MLNSKLFHLYWIFFGLYLEFNIITVIGRIYNQAKHLQYIEKKKILPLERNIKTGPNWHSIQIVITP